MAAKLNQIETMKYGTPASTPTRQSVPRFSACEAIRTRQRLNSVSRFLDLSFRQRMALAKASKAVAATFATA